MPRTARHPPLNVFLNSRHVGRLNRSSTGAVDFQYDRSWLDWENALPVSLSLPLREDRYIGAPVIAVFDNLLPDSDSIRRRLAEHSGAEGIDAYSLLSAVGRDCVGALRFLPDGIAPGPAGAVEGAPISDAEIEKLLANLASVPLGVEEDDDFRISIAGAQEKTALLFWKNRWRKPVGTTATTHILKPQIGHLPNGIDLSNSVENEYLCLKLTAALGLPTASAEITTFGKHRVLAVQRFDRLWTRDGRLLRVPQEDCCQALSVPPTLKYQSDGGPGIADILQLLKGSDDPGTDQSILLKSIIVFWLIGATDGHAKNFSIHLMPGGRFRLTPLYDVLTAQPSVDAGQIRRNKMKLALAVGKSRHYAVDTIAPRHFYETAAQAGVSAAVVDAILSDLQANAPSAVKDTLNALPRRFPKALVNSVAKGFGVRFRLLEISMREAARPS